MPIPGPTRELAKSSLVLRVTPTRKSAPGNTDRTRLREVLHVLGSVGRATQHTDVSPCRWV